MAISDRSLYLPIPKPSKWPKKPRKRLSSASKKRRKELKDYSALRKTFLLGNSWCEFWLSERGLTYKDISQDTGFVTARGLYYGLFCPRATEVHHKSKRRGQNLLDVSTWMAVCRESHEFIESHKSYARQKGYLVNF